MEVTFVIDEIRLSHMHDEAKISAVRSAVTLDNVESIPIDYSSDFNCALILIKLETQLIKQAPDQTFNETLNALATAAPYVKQKQFPDDYIRSFVKVKYVDILSDIQLANELYYNEVIECVSKKMVVSKSIKYQALVQEINAKCVELLMISNCDFRREQLINYIKELTDFNNLSPITTQLFQLVSKNQLIPLGTFDEFLGSIRYAHILKVVLTKGTIVENVMENNIFNLCQYYTCIQLKKISQMFDADYDLENLLVKMITNDKLPPGSRIDQKDGILIYGHTRFSREPITIEKHITEVGMLLDELILMIK